MSSSQRTLPIRLDSASTSLLALTAVAALLFAGADASVRALMIAGLSENAAGTGVTLVAIVAGLTALLRLARAVAPG